MDRKLDRDLRNAVKENKIKANLLENKDVNSKNEAKDLEFDNKNNINMSIADSYLYAV